MKKKLIGLLLVVMLVVSSVAFIGCNNDNKSGVKVGTYKMTDTTCKAMSVVTLIQLINYGGGHAAEDLTTLKQALIEVAQGFGVEDFEPYIDEVLSGYTTAKDFWKDYDKAFEVVIKLNKLDQSQIDNTLAQAKAIMYFEVKSDVSISMVVMGFPISLTYTNDGNGNIVVSGPDGKIEMKYKDGVLSMGYAVMPGTIDEFALSVVDKIDFAI